MISTTQSIFERNPKKTFFLFLVVFIIVLEVSLKIYVHFLDELPTNPFENMVSPGIKISNELTHHANITNHKRSIINPGQHDTFDPVVFETNSIGIRGPEIGTKTIPRIIFVGDSFLEADEVSFDKTFSELLNNEFEGEIQFITHGVSSWAPTAEFSWIHNKGMILDPDEIYSFK